MADGVRDWSAEALRRHVLHRGKVQIMPKVAVRTPEDFAVWYTPGVAAPCRAIRDDPRQSFDLTNRANTVAIVSDGTRVLGLGNIGPAAGLPVMEGKALLFKLLGGVDAVPLCVAPRDEAALVDLVRALEPSFGGVNLEDIAQPTCFRVLERLRESMTIPVWHDDQQGSATALLAGLLNALAVVGKRLDRVRIALVGMGAANVSTYRLLKAAGVAPHSVVACDSKGILHPARTDLEGFAAKRRVAEETAPERSGGVAEALAGADVCVAFTRSGPGIIDATWIRGMAANAIVMACANPVPEIWPDEAMAAGARIVATGRGDLRNQVNNALVFPGLFRGVLDIRARRITDGMALAAARELAAIRVEAGLDEHHILPALDDATVAPRVAAAAAAAAVAEGTAEGPFEREAFIARARDTIADVRAAVARLLRTP